jgi:hypothetical protein
MRVVCFCSPIAQHYNRFVKTATRGSGANRIQSMDTLSRAGPSLDSILDEFDEQCGLRSWRGRRKDTKSREHILSTAKLFGDIQGAPAFVQTPGRSYTHFENFPRNLFARIKPDEMVVYLQARRDRVSKRQGLARRSGNHLGAFVLPPYSGALR